MNPNMRLLAMDEEDVKTLVDVQPIKRSVGRSFVAWMLRAPGRGRPRASAPQELLENLEYAAAEPLEQHLGQT